MNIQYDINTLFEIAFGYRTIAALEVNVSNREKDETGLNYDQVAIAENVEEAEKWSHLGTPIIFPITFIGKSYQVYNSIGQIDLENFEDFDLPAATLSHFRLAKVIRTTQIPGSSGTVKEIFGSDDWLIDLKGICLADPGHAYAKTAFDQHQELVRWSKVMDAIEVYGKLFASKGIESLVIEEINFSAIQGKPGFIPFTIRAKSDKPIELLL